MSKIYSIKTIIKVLIIIPLIICFQKGDAQTIKLIPNPDAGNKSVSSYVVYNNQLYTGYTDPTGRTHLARWNGAGLTVIPNPDNGGGFADFTIVYNNKLYFRYQNQSGIYQIAQYDGNIVTLISNPDGGLGFNYPGTVPSPKPIVFNGKLFIQYASIKGTKLASFDGTTLQIVLTHDNLSTYIGRPIIYNSKLYTGWFTNDFVSHLVEYDGSSFKIITNPDNGLGIADFSSNDIVTYPDPIIFNNKLYYPYNIESNHQQFGLSQYDGTNLTLIPNPTNSSNTVGPWYNNFIVYNNKLYLNYYDTGSINGAANILGTFDGNKLSLIQNYDSSQLSILNFQFIIYNKKLYFINVYYHNPYYLTSFDGTQISEIPNSGTDLTEAIVYHNKLYSSTNFSLTQYDGENIKQINNLSSGAYQQYPFIFNDTLFFVYEESLNYHLAYLDDGSSGPLPISLLNFSAQLENNNTILNWQTATESNTSYFNILRSIDGNNFSTIGKVSAAGNSSVIKNYSYTDETAIALKVNKVYYRLQEIDKDGNGTNSKIEAVNFSGIRPIFSISPNPAKDFINLISSATIANATIKITALNGKTLYEAKHNFVAGEQVNINISQFAKDILIVNIKSANNNEQIKIITQ